MKIELNDDGNASEDAAEDAAQLKPLLGRLKDQKD